MCLLSHIVEEYVTFKLLKHEESQKVQKANMQQQKKQQQQSRQLFALNDIKNKTEAGRQTDIQTNHCTGIKGWPCRQTDPQQNIRPSSYFPNRKMLQGRLQHHHLYQQQRQQQQQQSLFNKNFNPNKRRKQKRFNILDFV